MAKAQKRLTAKDWELAALKVIAKTGVSAVSIEALARDLGVTKGSFYWHFRNRDALLAACLERWEKRFTIATMDELEKFPEPQARLKRLFELVYEALKNPGLNAAWLAASEHEVIKPVLQRDGVRRFDYGIQLFKDLGMNDDEAVYRALLTHCAYAGFMNLNRELPPEALEGVDLAAYVQHMLETLLPAK